MRTMHGACAMLLRAGDTIGRANNMCMKATGPMILPAIHRPDATYCYNEGALPGYMYLQASDRRAWSTQRARSQ